MKSSAFIMLIYSFITFNLSPVWSLKHGSLFWGSVCHEICIFLSHSWYILGQATFLYFVDLVNHYKKPEISKFGPAGPGAAVSETGDVVLVLT